MGAGQAASSFGNAAAAAIVVVNAVAVVDVGDPGAARGCSGLPRLANGNSHFLRCLPCRVGADTAPDAGWARIVGFAADTGCPLAKVAVSLRLAVGMGLSQARPARSRSADAGWTPVATTTGQPASVRHSSIDSCQAAVCCP